MDQFLMPMVLASDAVLSDGEMIGDPTEGALVALAAKGGVGNATETRSRHTREIRRASVRHRLQADG